MSYLLFAPESVKALAPQVVPEEEQPIFDYAARCAILSASSDLSRDTFVLTGQVIGEGPLCTPLWLRDRNAEARS